MHRPAPAVKLTRERIAELAQLEHVERVVVGEAYTVWAVLGDRTDQALAISAGLRDEQFRDRVIAGDFFTSPDSRDVLVSELLMYKLGVRDDADLNAAVGRTLRLELRGRGPAPAMMLLTLLNAGGPMSSAEEQVLTKVLNQLPLAVARMEGLTPQELATLQTMLSRPPDRPTKRADAVVMDLTIRGVLRTAEESEAAGRWNWVNREADVVLPPTTAAGLFSRLGDHGEQGYRSVLLEVDSIDNVKEVAKQVEAKGFGTYTLMQYVEAERYLYLLIFAGMSLIAIVALTVSALGIGNTMLMGVLERVREIGVMKAVGAGEGQIQLLFLIEGMLIGLVGGLIGLGVAFGLSLPGDAWVRSLLAGNTTIKLDQSLFVWPWWLWVGAPLFACGLTTLAAVYPARRAAKVNTVEALRHE
jgi:putative ABC transport system permease protein